MGTPRSGIKYKLCMWLPPINISGQKYKQLVEINNFAMPDFAVSYGEKLMKSGAIVGYHISYYDDAEKGWICKEKYTKLKKGILEDAKPFCTIVC